MHDRQAFRLGQCDHERLLPIGHEAGVHVGLDGHRVQVAARMPEANALVGDVKLAADLAEHVKEGHHVSLRGALDEHVAAGGKRRGSPRGGFDAVGQCGVGEALELFHAFDAEGAVHVHGDDCAHLLQNRDQIHDFRFDGRAGQFRLAFGEHSRQQGLLGGPNRWVRQMDFRAMQAVRSGDMDAVLVFLVDVGAEFAQSVEMEVDRTPTDIAAAERRNERLAQAMHEWAGEQDRNA